MRKLFFILIALVLALVLLPSIVVFAADSGTSSGSFSVGGVAPAISALEIYTTASCDTVAAALTPQVEYYVKVTASDANTVNDIKEMDVTLYYDALASHPVAPGVTNEQTAAIFTWAKAGNTWTVNADAGASWVAIDADSVIPADMTHSSSDWIFAIKIGKTANESVAPAVWDLHALATDNANHTAERYTYDKSVLWYGETTVLTGTIDFSEVAIPSGFGADVNKVTGVQVKYVVNGNYSVQIKSSAAWTGVTNIATLDSTGLSAAGATFSIKTFYSDIYASAILLDSVPTTIRANGTQTLETGYTTTTGTFWLRVTSPFPTDVYHGTITFTIINR